MPSCPVAHYAAEAIASSYYHGHTSDYGWHPDAALGPPTRPDICDDGPGAWSPASGGEGYEWLRVTFDQAVFATKLEVWETGEAAYEPSGMTTQGFITEISFEDDTGSVHPNIQGRINGRWQGTLDNTLCGRVFTLELPAPTTYAVKHVRITTSYPGYEEVDAVRLSGSAPCEPPYPPSPPPPPPSLPPLPPPPPPISPPASPPWYIPTLTSDEWTNFSILLPSALFGVLFFWYLLIACRSLDPCWPLNEARKRIRAAQGKAPKRAAVRCKLCVCTVWRAALSRYISDLGVWKRVFACLRSGGMLSCCCCCFRRCTRVAAVTATVVKSEVEGAVEEAKEVAKEVAMDVVHAAEQATDGLAEGCLPPDAAGPSAAAHVTWEADLEKTTAPACDAPASAPLPPAGAPGDASGASDAALAPAALVAQLRAERGAARAASAARRAETAAVTTPLPPVPPPPPLPPLTAAMAACETYAAYPAAKAQSSSAGKLTRLSSSARVAPEVFDGTIMRPLPTLTDPIGPHYSGVPVCASGGRGSGMDAAGGVHLSQREPRQWPSRSTSGADGTAPALYPQLSVPASACFTAFSASQARLAPMCGRSLSDDLRRDSDMMTRRSFGAPPETGQCGALC